MLGGLRGMEAKEVRVTYFQRDDPQEEINKFLAANPEITIYDIKFKVSRASLGTTSTMVLITHSPIEET